MKQTTSLRIGQQLSMTPALQQAIRLLQMSTLDLQQEIQEALETNVMLEQVEEGLSSDPAESHAETGKADSEPVESTSSEESIPEELPVDAEWDDVFDLPTTSATNTNNSEAQELDDFRQASLYTPPTLAEHLQWQANIHPFDDDGLEIAHHIIDAINEEGYLEDWPALEEQLLALPEVNEKQLRNTLRSVQSFDPPGVAARDLNECLALQIRQLQENHAGQAHGSNTTTRALQILAANALAQLANGPSAELAEQLHCSVEQLGEALQLIQSLNPKPGSQFISTEFQYVVPEVFVAKQRGKWRVSLNPDISPRLQINPYYQSLVRRSDRSEEQQTLKNHLQEARFFLNSLHSRNETLLRVARCIVEEQRAFLDYGAEAMKPLILRDISERLGVHESTVSRATAHKYMHTPRGLFELKYFFSSHVGTTSGGTASATAIQAMIKRLITEEKPNKPLSDSHLAKLLLESEVKVARRTVAKYREAMGIPPSHERKRPA